MMANRAGRMLKAGLLSRVIRQDDGFDLTNMLRSRFKNSRVNSFGGYLRSAQISHLHNPFPVSSMLLLTCS
jgi:hypothetical protein